MSASDVGKNVHLSIVLDNVGYIVPKCQGIHDFIEKPQTEDDVTICRLCLAKGACKLSLGELDWEELMCAPSALAPLSGASGRPARKTAGTARRFAAAAIGEEAPAELQRFAPDGGGRTATPMC